MTAAIAAAGDVVAVLAVSLARLCSLVLLCGLRLHLPAPHLGPSVGTCRPRHFSRLPVVHLARRWLCLLVLLQGLSPPHHGLLLLTSHPGLSVGTRRPWPPLSAPWLHPFLSGLPRSPTQALLTTLLPTRVYSHPFALPLQLILPPSWSLMARVFLSRPWVPPALMALFVFPTFLLHLLWFTTFFLFASLLLTTPALLSLTLLVLL